MPLAKYSSTPLDGEPSKLDGQPAFLAGKGGITLRSEARAASSNKPKVKVQHNHIGLKHRMNLKSVAR